MTMTESEFEERFGEVKNFLTNRLGLEATEEEMKGQIDLINAFQEYAQRLAEHALEAFKETPTADNFFHSISSAFLTGIIVYHTAIKFSGMDMDNLDKAVIVGMENLNK